MKKIKKYMESIPLTVINTISILSGLFTILSFLTTLIGYFISMPRMLKYSLISFGIFAVIFGYLYWKKLAKYRQLAQTRLEVHSKEMSLANQKVTDILFDVLHYYKVGQLNSDLLCEKIKSSLVTLLNSLVNIMKLDTGKEINACIKLIMSSGEEITIDNAQVQTFARSEGELSRSAYDTQNPGPFFVKDNTDFFTYGIKRRIIFMREI